MPGWPRLTPAGTLALCTAVQLGYAATPQVVADFCTPLTEPLCHHSIDKITRVISLRGCTSITGTGLHPLRRSLVLKQIDLRIGLDHHLTPGPTGLAELEVVSILSDVLQGGDSTLRMIQFRRMTLAENFWEGMSQPFRRLTQQLHIVLRERVVRSRTKCGFCKVGLSVLLSVEELDSAAALDRCSGGCGLHSCFRNSLSKCPSVDRCTQCDASYCEKCRVLKQCFECNNGWCDECSDSALAVCSSCTETSCNVCRPSFSCTTCAKTICENCEDEDGFHTCVKCDKKFCEDCEVLSFCGGCHESFCEDCGCEHVGFCGGCHESFCEDCKHLSFCGGCHESFCEDCKHVSFCGGCHESFCEDCKHLSFCGGCYQSFCEDCKHLIFCEVCLESLTFCDGCVHEHNCRAAFGR